MKDHYLILGVEPSATSESIKKAYKQLALKYHPDKNQGDKYFEERFKDIHESYLILIDIQKRKVYDYERLAFYRKNNLGNENKFKEAEYLRKEQELKRKQDEYLQWEANLRVRERELQKTSITSNGNSTTIFLVISALAVLVIWFISGRDIKKNQDIGKGYNFEETAVNDLPKKEIPKHNSDYKNNNLDINALPAPKMSDNRNENSQKTSSSKNKYQHLDEDIQEFSDDVFFNKSPNIEITNIVWEKYDFYGKVKGIKQISIYNKLDKLIKSVTIIYETINSSGDKINSGEFVINPPSYYGGEKHFDDGVQPLMAKAFDIRGAEVPTKTSTDVLTLRVKGIIIDE